MFVSQNALLPGAGISSDPVFYVWPRSDRVILVVDPKLVKIGKVLSPAFRHDLSTILSGRKVVATNSRGIYLQIAYEPPPVPVSLSTEALNLADQPSPFHLPIGTTTKGPLWVSLLEMDSVLVGGSRRMGKTRLLHAWIQAMIHGGKCSLFLWDGKGGMEFARYGNAARFSDDLTELLAEINRERARRLDLFKTVGVTSSPEYNAIVDPGLHLPLLILVVDEVADVPDESRDMLAELVGRGGAAGIHPVIATTYPEAGRVQSFLKANVSTRICFPVPTHTESKVILNRTGAEKLPKVKGRIMFVWDANTITAQTFQVDLPDPSGAGLLVGPIITDDERRLVELAINEADGRMTIELIMEWDKRLSTHSARKLAEEWEAKGWLEKDAARKNARFITPLLWDILSQTARTAQTPQTAQTSVDPGANRSQTAEPDDNGGLLCPIDF